jgi:pimeloyl-ACP methyl ester carboxylesterase
MIERRLANDPTALAACVKAYSPGLVQDMWRRLSGIQDGLTYICGGRDAKYGRIASRLSGSCPRAMTAIVPGCGHNVHLQAPQVCAGLVTV